MFEQVRQLLAHQFEVDENTITMDTNIADDLGADSLDVVELVMSIEDAFGITIEDEKAAELTTVRQVVDYLEILRKRSRQPVLPAFFISGNAIVIDESGRSG